MNAPAEPGPTDEAPQVAGVRVRPALPIALFVLLSCSAALGLWVQRRPQVAPPFLEQAAPWIFLLFAVGFAGYRFALVAARRYSAFKAFFQVSVSAVFFLLLLPGSPVAPPPPSSLVDALDDAHPKVRALAAEVAGLRPEPSAARALVRHLADSDPEVRAAAHAALVRLNQGADLGSPEDASARGAWEARFP
ncbi:MAG: HEAT repeat domain-containing protein [Myxococcaceae bacterium]|nr:HEAT repeat domain-containing protein [Myxococcaceae bacterium]